MTSPDQDQRELNRIHDVLYADGLPSDETAVTLYAGLMGARQALAFWRKSPEELKITYKVEDGFTPVSEADRRSEIAMTEVFKRYYPAYSIYGEDTERVQGLDPNNTVVMDGVDGSLTFIRGDYTWAVANSLCRRDPQVGEKFPVTAATILPKLALAIVSEKDRWTMAFDLDYKTLELDGIGRICSVSNPKPDQSTSPVYDFVIGPDGILIEETNALEKESFLRLLRGRAKKINIRAGGSNSHSGAQVATGMIDATIMDCIGGVFDALPSALLVEGADGRYTDGEGNRLSIERTEKIHYTVGSNGAFHDELLEIARLAEPSFRDYNGWRTARISGSH